MFDYHETYRKILFDKIVYDETLKFFVSPNLKVFSDELTGAIHIFKYPRSRVARNEFLPTNTVNALLYDGCAYH